MSEGNRVVFLKGKITVLRPPAESDLPKVTQWVNDPEVRRYISSIFPQSEQDEEAWLAGLGKKKSTDLVFLIETSDGRPIGLMGIHNINWVDRTAMTGALIGEKDCWSQGYGSDAKMQLLRYAFYTLNLRKMCSGAYSFNERSIRYSLKCGYEQEAVFKNEVFRDGKYWDKVFLAIYREGFEAAWAKYEKGE